MAKRKVIPVQAMQAYWDSRGRAPLIFYQGIRWKRVVSPRSCFFNQGKSTHGIHSTARRF